MHVNVSIITAPIYDAPLPNLHQPPRRYLLRRKPIHQDLFVIPHCGSSTLLATVSGAHRLWPSGVLARRLHNGGQHSTVPSTQERAFTRPLRLPTRSQSSIPTHRFLHSSSDRSLALQHPLLPVTVPAREHFTWSNPEASSAHNKHRQYSSMHNKQTNKPAHIAIAGGVTRAACERGPALRKWRHVGADCDLACKTVSVTWSTVWGSMCSCCRRGAKRSIAQRCDAQILPEMFCHVRVTRFC